MAKFLDYTTGLPALWAKIKGLKSEVDDKFSEVPHNIPYVLQTNTSSVAALTGTTSELTELVDGQSIIYHFLYASKSSGTLNLTLADGTTTGAVNVYYGGSTRLTSHCAAGNDYRLTYHKNIAISGSGSYTGWWVEGNYDTNTYDRVRLSNSFVFSADAAASTICGKSTTGNYIKIVAGSVIDITYPIAWLSSAVTISSATTSTNLYSQYPSCTLRNNVSGWTGTSGAMAYLYGTLSGTALTVTGFTSTPPTSDDGNVYIPIGYLYSTYQVNFYCQNIVWWYKDGAFRPYSLYQDLSGYALSADVPTKTSDLTNDSGFITSSDIVQSDWEEDDTTNSAHVLNRPAVRAGDGTNAVVVGQIEDEEDTATYTLYLTGEANATVYNFTTNDTLPSSFTSSLTNKQSLVYRPSVSSGKYEKFNAIDLTNNTITFPYTLSKSNPITQEEIVIYYKKQTALGTRSLAEGVFTSATGVNSHAEGQYSKALGGGSHAEGLDAVAQGSFSHAEGNNTYVKGSVSHAEGIGTVAASWYQHVQGKYNIEDADAVYADIVGNGTKSSARSNAYTLDWSGNGWFAGKVSAGTAAAPANPTAANDLATKAYVDSATSGITTNLAGLTDTTITNPTSGQALVYNGTSWINGDVGGGIFYVTMTASTVDGETVYTANESFDDAYAAYQAGRDVKLMGTANVIYDLSVANAAGMMFQGNTASAISRWVWTKSTNKLTENGTTQIASKTYVDNAIPTYSLSISGSTITLTGTDGTTSSVSLPIYDGSVTEVWNGGVY